MNELARIAEYLNELEHDFRAESIVADLLENGFAQSEVVIVPDGSFSRKYAKDVSYAEVQQIDNGQQLFKLHLTRDGLYDSLPEALFHAQPVKPLSGGHEMAVVSKNQKQEEKAARRFFLPFENELFNQRLAVEHEERKMLYNFTESLLGDAYPQFWNLDKNLPRKYTKSLVMVLHFAHRIVGDLELTAHCLKMILDEEVKINHLKQGLRIAAAGALPVKQSPGLGSCALGDDFICGNYNVISDPVLEFVIGPLKNIPVTDLLENGSVTRFLDCFYGYFVPVEMDVITTISMSRDQGAMVLSADGNAPVMGFNSSL